MAYRDQYTIRQGRITLYRRTDEGGKHQSDAWYAALKIPGQKTIRRSLKTADKLEAESFAENLWFDLSQRNDRGLSLSPKRFDLVAKAYLREFTGSVDRDRNIPERDRIYRESRLVKIRLIITKFLIPFFNDKNIQDITDRDVNNFKNWRRTYWVASAATESNQITYSRKDGHKITRPRNFRENREPNWNTINKNLTTLRAIFSYACDQGTIESREVPKITNVSRPKNANNKKPGLTEEEVKHLLSTLLDMYKSQTNPKHKLSHKLLLHYVAWMCLTGMRVTEAKSLKISDCRAFDKNEVKYLKIYVSGKGKSRELVGLEESSIVLNKLIYFHKTSAENFGWEFHKDIPLFTNQYGKPVGSFTNALNKALNKAGLLHDAHGTKRNAGAFRKYYITHALMVGNINYFELAKQCGTSVSVIEEFYAAIDVTERPESFVFNNALTGVYDDNPANEHI